MGAFLTVFIYPGQDEFICLPLSFHYHLREIFSLRLQMKGKICLFSFLQIAICALSQRDSIFGADNEKAVKSNTGSFFIYDWPGVSPNWVGENLFQWSLATHGYGNKMRISYYSV